MYEQHQEILEKTFMQRERNAIYGLLEEAYLLTNSLIERNSWLTETAVGRDIRPDIIRAAIGKASLLWQEKGVWGFYLSCPLNSKRNCHYYELHRDGISLLFSRTGAPEAIPKKSSFRENLFNIHMDLFEDCTIRKAQYDKSGFLITYGDCGLPELQFARIGIPGLCGWLASLPLNRGPYTFVEKNEHEEMLVELQHGVGEEVRQINEDGK